MQNYLPVFSVTVCSPCSEISWIGGSCTLGCHACYAGVKMLYASPVWWGSITAAAKQRLQSLLSKLQRVGFLPQQFSTFAELSDRSPVCFSDIQPCACTSQLAPSNPLYRLWSQKESSWSFNSASWFFHEEKFYNSYAVCILIRSVLRSKTFCLI